MSRLTRRKVLQLLAALPVAPYAAGCGSGAGGNSGGPSPTPASGTSTTATPGSTVSIPNPLYGLNSGDNLAHFTGDASFMNAFGQLGPSLLRYPGGNSANWFDLSTGFLLTNANPPPPSGQLSSFTTPPAWSFSALAVLLGAAGAQATIVVNLLTGNMQSQIAALQAAAGAVAISRIELGNELYLNGVDGTQYEQVFPTVQDYASAANAWAAALRAAFPSVELGVPVDLNPGSATRESSWNQTLIPLLSSDIGALIPHNYQDPPNPPFTGASVSADASALAATGGVAAILSRVTNGTDTMKALASSWPNYKIWNTETNLRDPVGAIANTWTHGLYVAYQLLALLEVPNLAAALVHAVTNGTEYSAIWTSSGNFPDSSTQYVTDSLSATGLTMQLVFRAARKQSAAQPLAFSTNPSQTGSNGGSAPSLYGWVFGSGAGASAVVLNLSATVYALTFAQNNLFSGASYTQLSGNPTAYVGTPSNLTTSQGSFNAVAGLSLPKYSITLFTT